MNSYHRKRVTLVSSVHNPKLWDNDDLPLDGGDGEGVAVPVGLPQQPHQSPHAQPNPRNIQRNPPSTTSSACLSQRMQGVLACYSGKRCCWCCYEVLLRIKSWEVAYLLLGRDSGSRLGWQCSCWPGLAGPGTAGACCCRRTTESCPSRATHKAGHSLVLPALDSGRQTLSWFVEK